MGSREAERLQQIREVRDAPMYIIRYNPDAFKVGCMTTRVARGDREALLLSRIQHAIEEGCRLAYLIIEFLFYDSALIQPDPNSPPYVRNLRFETADEYARYVEAAQWDEQEE